MPGNIEGDGGLRYAIGNKHLGQVSHREHCRGGVCHREHLWGTVCNTEDWGGGGGGICHTEQ